MLRNGKVIVNVCWDGTGGNWWELVGTHAIYHLRHVTFQIGEQTMFFPAVCAYIYR